VPQLDKNHRYFCDLGLMLSPGTPDGGATDVALGI
jgi:hypothetical protein